MCVRNCRISLSGKLAGRETWWVWWAELPPPVGSRPVVILTCGAVLPSIGGISAWRRLLAGKHWDSRSAASFLRLPREHSREKIGFFRKKT